MINILQSILSGFVRITQAEGVQNIRFTVVFKGGFYKPSLSFYGTGQVRLTLHRQDVIDKSVYCPEMVVVTDDLTRFADRSWTMPEGDGHIFVKNYTENFGITDCLVRAGIINHCQWVSPQGDGYMWAICTLTDEFKAHWAVQ